VVVDGAVRDSLEIDEMDYPVFSVGTNPNGPTKNIGGRIGHPDDLDGAAVYFLSDASRFVTGQVLTIDGGWSVTDGGDSPAAESRPASP